MVEGAPQLADPEQRTMGRECLGAIAATFERLRQFHQIAVVPQSHEAGEAPERVRLSRVRTFLHSPLVAEHCQVWAEVDELGALTVSKPAAEGVHGDEQHESRGALERSGAESSLGLEMTRDILR